MPGADARPVADDAAELGYRRSSYRRSRCRVDDDGGE